jgi:hypothetical protein
VCATLYIFHEPFLAHACRLIDNLAHSMSPRGAATCLWALGRLSYHPQATVIALAARMATVDNGFDGFTEDEEIRNSCHSGRRARTDANSFVSDESFKEITFTALKEDGCSEQQGLSLARSLTQALHACATLGAEGPAVKALCARTLQYLQHIAIHRGSLQQRGGHTSGSESDSADSLAEGVSATPGGQKPAWPGRFQTLTLACWSAVILNCHRDRELMAPLLLVCRIRLTCPCFTATMHCSNHHSSYHVNTGGPFKLLLLIEFAGFCLIRDFRFGANRVYIRIRCESVAASSAASSSRECIPSCTAEPQVHELAFCCNFWGRLDT